MQHPYREPLRPEPREAPEPARLRRDRTIAVLLLCAAVPQIALALASHESFSALSTIALFVAAFAVWSLCVER